MRSGGGELYFKNELADGNPFTLRGAKELMRLGILTIAIPLGKTGKKGDYIGQYGEGFKMAVLRIVQMGGMDLCMHSQDWCIRPVVYNEYIEDKEIKMLGYTKESVEDDGNTTLTIRGIPLSEKETLKNGLLDFFSRGMRWWVIRSGKGMPTASATGAMSRYLAVSGLMTFEAFSL